MDDTDPHCETGKVALQDALVGATFEIKIYEMSDTAGGNVYRGWVNYARGEIVFADSLFVPGSPWFQYLEEVIGHEADHAGNDHFHDGVQWGTTFGPSHFQQYFSGCNGMWEE